MQLSPFRQGSLRLWDKTSLLAQYRLKWQALVEPCLGFVSKSLSFFVLFLSSQGLADEFVNFLAKQKIGQEITVTGGFRRFNYKKHFFHRNEKTGEVKNFDYFGMTMVPTLIIGDGILLLQTNVIDAMLLLYEDQELVKDLPEQGENMVHWHSHWISVWHQWNYYESV